MTLVNTELLIFGKTQEATYSSFFSVAVRKNVQMKSNFRGTVLFILQFQAAVHFCLEVRGRSKSLTPNQVQRDNTWTFGCMLLASFFPLLHYGGSPTWGMVLPTVGWIVLN